MGAIVPAILVKTRKELEEKLTRLSGLVDSVQIDVVDGALGGAPTWPYTDERCARECTELISGGEMIAGSDRFRLEADLMVAEPEKAADAWIALGASRVTIHAKSVQDLPAVFTRLSARFGHEKGFAPDMLAFGVALGAGEDFSVLEPVLGQVDYVQLMGIRHIGVQGEPFDERVIETVRALHAKHPDVLIQVDGGVSLANAPKLLAAGASQLVIGSAIWHSTDVPARIHELQELALRYGMYNR